MSRTENVSGRVVTVDTIQTECGRCWRFEPDDPKETEGERWGTCQLHNASRTYRMRVVLAPGERECFLPNFITVLRDALPKEEKK